MIVWWAPRNQRTLFFSDRGEDPVLKAMNEQIYPQPALLFKACGSHLWIRALGQNERPMAETRMWMAPYWNCYDNGVVCTGSMKIPRERSIASIETWEESFFGSEFTHASGVRKHTRFAGVLLAMWQSLRGKNEFPSKHLVRLPQKLSEFIHDNDHGYRNQARQVG